MKRKLLDSGNIWQKSDGILLDAQYRIASRRAVRYH